MTKHIHIVCFDAPAPANYGGAIDLFYKIIALSNAGIKVSLHYFQYNTERGHKGLENYCYNIFTYSRKSPLACMLSPLPYIVSSRINKELIDRLNEDEYPVVLEGVHTCGILPFIKKGNRSIVVRMHNNEAAYYQRLAHTETAPLKNFYYLVESNRLERYQQKLPKDINYASLSDSDCLTLINKYGLQHTHFLPAFLPWQHVAAPTGIGDFCLYHGNLSVAENKAVVFWLIQYVFAKTDVPFFIAGKNAPPQLQQKIEQLPHVQLINNPADDILEDLVRNAHIHILPSLNQTGVKLKLLHALFCGKHCITNNEGVAGSGLNDLVHLAEDADTFITTIKKLMQQPFTENEMQQRLPLLHLYDNTRNADALIALI